MHNGVVRQPHIEIFDQEEVFKLIDFIIMLSVTIFYSMWQVDTVPPYSILCTILCAHHI